MSVLIRRKLSKCGVFNTNNYFIALVLLRSVLLERKQSQKEEEEMMEQIQATVTEGKAKIEERFAELTKELTEGLEREKGRMEAQYVSP